MFVKANIKTIAGNLKSELRYYQLIAKHERTPRLAKVLMGMAVAYALSPIDLIPDFIPVLGQLDDLIIVPGLIWIAVKMIPEAVLSECRTQTEEAGTR